MDFQLLNEIFTADFNIDSIISVVQNRYEGVRFNFLESPRRSHGLFLLTDYPVVYELPEGNCLQANPGDVMLLPKGAHYAINFAPPPEKTSHPVMINFRLTTPEGSEISLGEQVMLLCRDNGTLLPLFTASAQLYKSASPARLKAKVYELFGALFPVAETDECCLAYIGRHYTDRFSIPKLAERCAMSETAYRKRFRQLTGQSPVQYINRLKIEKACLMLTGGDISPNTISEFLNFYSPAYFYKVFKDCTGMTPNQYRDVQTASPQP